MKTAKLFQHGGSQAVRLPRQFRFAGGEVAIEKRGDEVILRPVAKTTFSSLAAAASYLMEKYPTAAEFPDVERPRAEQKRDLRW